MEGKKIQNFTDLDAWTKAHELVIAIYKLTGSFPQNEIFGLTNQMRRAAVSITSNIAEGFGRYSFKEKIRFYYISKGSIAEIKNQLLISRDIKIIDEFKFKIINDLIDHSYKLLNGLISKTRTLITYQFPDSNL